MDISLEYYVLWLGRLKYMVNSGSWSLSDTRYLQRTPLYHLEDQKIRFYSPQMESPISLITESPCRPVLRHHISKNPFQSHSTPLDRSHLGWAWSPLLGWCYIERRYEQRAIWVPEEGEDRSSPTLEAASMLGNMTSLWHKDQAAEFLMTIPLYRSPQIFAAVPCEQKETQTPW